MQSTPQSILSVAGSWPARMKLEQFYGLPWCIPEWNGMDRTESVRRCSGDGRVRWKKIVLGKIAHRQITRDWIAERESNRLVGDPPGAKMKRQRHNESVDWRFIMSH